MKTWRSMGSGVTEPQGVGSTWASAFYKAAGLKGTVCVGTSGQQKRKLGSNMADNRCSRKEEGQRWSLQQWRPKEGYLC